MTLAKVDELTPKTLEDNVVIFLETHKPVYRNISTILKQMKIKPSRKASAILRHFFRLNRDFLEVDIRGNKKKRYYYRLKNINETMMQL